MNDDQIREEFEAWFRQSHHNRLDRNMPDKSYNCPAAHSSWAAWQAAIASRPTQPVDAEPVAWWKQFPRDTKPAVVPGSTFLAEDALACGWRPLTFADAAPVAKDRAALVELCAVTAWNTGMGLHRKQHDAREVGAACAKAIRALAATKDQPCGA